MAKDINIDINAKDNVSVVTDKIIKNINKMKTSQKDATTKKNLEQTAGLGTILNMNLTAWQKTNKEGYNYSNVGARVGNTIRTVTHGLRGFRMEALGVMFFGMGMARVFNSMLQPAMEAGGIFDLLKTTLLDLFLPVIIDVVLPAMLSLMEFFMGLGPEVKMTMGLLAIAGSVIGTALMAVGAILLGVGSLILLFGASAGAALAIAIAAFVALIGVVITFRKPIFSIIKVLWDLSKAVYTFVKNALISFVEFSIKVIDTFISIRKKVTDKITDLIVGVALKIKDFRDKIAEKVKPISDLFKSPFQRISDLISPILDKILTKVKEKIQPVIDLISKLKEKYTALRVKLGFEKPTIESATSTESQRNPYAPLPTSKVEDFIISGNRVLQTNPADTIFGTKTPEDFNKRGGSTNNNNITVSPTINITGASADSIDARDLADKVGEIVLQNLRRMTLM